MSDLPKLPATLSTDGELPAWAAGVMCSVGTSTGAYSRETTESDYDERLDPDTGISFLAGRGVFVVAIDKPSPQSLASAVTLLQKLKTQPLDVAALALPEQSRMSAQDVNELAARGIVVARVAAESANARAVKFIKHFLASRSESLQHLDDLARSSLASQRPMSPSLKRRR